MVRKDALLGSDWATDVTFLHDKLGSLRWFHSEGSGHEFWELLLGACTDGHDGARKR